MEAFLLWARYNQVMNQQLYAACEQLEPEQLNKDLGAFFGSVYRTLNHIIIADVYWLGRLSGTPFPLLDETGEPIKVRGLDQILYPGLAQLQPCREALDLRIIECIQDLARQSADPGAGLDRILEHRLADGTVVHFTLNKALCHWFNHQTHHRGQVTTLLSQLQVDVGVTDLLLMDLG